MKFIIAIALLCGTALAVSDVTHEAQQVNPSGNQDLHTEATGIHGGYAFYPGIGQVYPFGGYYPGQYGQYPSEYGTYYHPQYSQYAYQQAVPNYNPYSYNQRYQQQ